MNWNWILATCVAVILAYLVWALRRDWRRPDPDTTDDE